VSGCNPFDNAECTCRFDQPQIDKVMEKNDAATAVVVTLHCAGTTIMILWTLVFIDLQRGKWKELIQNQFNSLTVVSSTSLILCELIFIVRKVMDDFKGGEGKPTSNVLLFFVGLFMVLAIEIHVGLLSLRTQGIMINADKSWLHRIYLNLFKAIAVVGVLVVLLRIELFFDVPSDQMTVAFSISSGIFGLLVSCIDGISTHWFIKYIRHVEVLGASEMHHFNQKNRTISQLGILICSCSLVSTILYAVSMIVTSKLLHDCMILVVTLIFFAIGILWMNMKIELDAAARDKQRGQASTVIQLVSLSDKEWTSLHRPVSPKKEAESV
jgi:hypothetical protein